MATIAVVELDFRRKLHIAGGADSDLFNMVTRRCHNMKCNEYDAAAAFVAADLIDAYRTGEDGSVSLLDAIHTTIRLMPMMARPDDAERNINRAQEAAV